MVETGPSATPTTPPPLSTNLAFAAPGLKAALALTDAQYGMGSSLFFVGYCGAQVPLVAAAARSRAGPVPWLCASCVAWGALAAATACVKTPAQFYAARVALGVAEAPSFPLLWGVIHSFYAEREIGAAFAWVTATIAVDSISEISGRTEGSGCWVTDLTSQKKMPPPRSSPWAKNL